MAYLDRGIPNLLCVEQWSHWVTAVGTDGQRFVLLDSRDRDVVRILRWDRLRPLVAYTPRSRAGAVYDLHPLLPRRPGPLRAWFTVERALELARPANRSLARHWDRFVTALTRVVSGRLARWDDLFARPLAQLIEEEAEPLLERLAGSAAGKAAAGRYLDGLAFVAETYDVAVPYDRRDAILEDVAVAYREWAQRSDTTATRR